MPSFGTWVKELGLLRPFSVFCIYRVGLENKYHLGLSSASQEQACFARHANPTAPAPTGKTKTKQLHRKAKPV